MSGMVANLLIVALAMLLLVAAIGDLRDRIIPNWLNAAIALLAIPYWWASGLMLWPDVAIQIGVALIVFAIFAAAFAAGAMGGGDVKMIAALALWLVPSDVLRLLVVMALAGGALTVAMLARRRFRTDGDQIEVPYGVAIAFGGFWLIGEPILNQFG